MQKMQISTFTTTSLSTCNTFNILDKFLTIIDIHSRVYTNQQIESKETQ